MTDQLPRLIAMLRHLPRAPRKITAAELATKLEGLGYSIHARSVQRDLMKLADIYPDIKNDDHNKPYGWCWAKNAPVFDIPGLSVHTALALKMAEDYLHTVLPRASLDYLRPYFSAANEELKKCPSNLAAWQSKVRVIPRGPALLPPKIDKKVHDAVYDALMNEYQLLVAYKKVGALKQQDYLLHPLSVVARDGVLYLLAMAGDDDDVKQFALHRMTSAEHNGVRSRKANDFDLDAYIAAGNFGFATGDIIKLDCRFMNNAGFHLRETPLSEDQTITEETEGVFRLQATVPDSGELLWWLLGFGENIQVLGPRSLKKEFKAVVSQMAVNAGV